MFPLRKREVILPGGGATGHVKRGLGIATDYKADYEPLVMPFAGTLYVPYWWTFNRGQGGKWLGIRRPNEHRIEFAHLSRSLQDWGAVAEGTVIAITGNTGTITTGPHLHVQIFDGRNRRLDPEQYDWNGENVPLLARVNEALRDAGSIVDAKRSVYWQDRVARGEKTTFENLVGGIRYRIQRRLAPHEDGR